MRFPVLVLGTIALSACHGGPNSSSSVAPPPAEAAFRLTPDAVSFDNRHTEQRGAATFVCGDVRIRWSIEALSGIGGQVVREQSTVVEGDGGTQPGQASSLSVAVPPTGSATVATERAFCGQSPVDFPARFDWQLTLRDDRGVVYGLTFPTSLQVF